MTTMHRLVEVFKVPTCGLLYPRKELWLSYGPNSNSKNTNPTHKNFRFSRCFSLSSISSFFSCQDRASAVGGFGTPSARGRTGRGARLGPSSSETPDSGEDLEELGGGGFGFDAKLRLNTGDVVTRTASCGDFWLILENDAAEERLSALLERIEVNDLDESRPAWIRATLLGIMVDGTVGDVFEEGVREQVCTYFARDRRTRALNSHQLPVSRPRSATPKPQNGTPPPRHLRRWYQWPNYSFLRREIATKIHKNHSRRKISQARRMDPVIADRKFQNRTRSRAEDV